MTAADGDVPPAFTRRLERVLRSTRDLAAHRLIAAGPEHRSVHGDRLASVWDDVRRRCALIARLSSAHKQHSHRPTH